MKRQLSLFLSLAIIVFFLQKIDTHKTISMLQNIELWPFVLGCFLLVSAHIVRASRWNFLLGKVVRVRKIDSSAIYFVGQVFNQIVPMGAGDMTTRVYFVRDIAKVRAAVPLSAVVVERLMDLLLLVTVVIMFLQAVLFQGISMYFLSVSFVVLLGLFFWILFFKEGFLENLVGKLKFIKKIRLSRLYDSLSDNSRHFREASRNYRGYKTIAVAMLMTVSFWVLEAGAYQAILRSFGFDVNLLLMVGIVLTSMVIGTYSFLPGGLGIREVVFAYLVGLAGVPFEAGFSAALLFRFSIYAFFGLSGGISSILLGGFSPPTMASKIPAKIRASMRTS